MDRDIEIAKSWFELARILGTMAGLFAIAAAFLMNSYGTTFSTYTRGAEICGSFPLEDNVTFIQDKTITASVCSQRLNNAWQATANLSFFLIAMSFLLAFASILYWHLGRSKLKDSTFEDGYFNVLIIVLFILLTALAYYIMFY